MGKKLDKMADNLQTHFVQWLYFYLELNFNEMVSLEPNGR